MLGFKLFYYANFLSYLGSSDFHFYSFGIHNLIRIKNICFEIIGQIASPTLPPSLHIKKCSEKTDTLSIENNGNGIGENDVDYQA